MADKLEALSVPVPEAGCFLWTASTETSGYGHGKHRGIHFRAHRAAWIEAYGPIPDGMCVLHKCDTPRCINPNHLFLGSAEDNIADRVVKRRSSGGSKSGERHPNAKLSGDDITVIRAMREEGKTQQAIADKFGVGRRCIGRILDGTRWENHTQEEA